LSRQGFSTPGSRISKRGHDLNQTETVLAAAESGGYHRGFLAAICCGVMALYAVYLGALGVVLPAVGASFHLGAAVSARLFAADFGGFVAGVLASGMLSDRFGRKSVLLFSLLLYAAGLALFGNAYLFAVTLFASACIGAGTGAMETVAAALASDVYPERRAYILNAVQVGFGVGAAIGPSVADTALGHHITWRLLYGTLAVVTVALTLLLALQAVPRNGAGGEAVNFGVLRSVLRQPMFLLLCLAQALYVGGETGFFSWIPTYFRQELPSGAAMAGLVVTIFWCAMTVGRMATGWLLQRIPLLRLTLWLAFGSAIWAALALVWKSPLAVQLCVAATGLCFSGIFGLILGETGEQYPTIAGTAFSGVVAAGGVGGAISPWLIGVLGDTVCGWRGALLLIPILMILLAGVTLQLQRLRAATPAV
jgi:MFS transporter, FHS family, glucose/mannose:H+ symporter